MGCFYQLYASQEMRPSVNEEDIKQGTEIKELVALKWDYMQEKNFTVFEL